ncbi:MAG: DUF3857 domain-containing protein [Acidobacteria bacterium]|nr:DUF3857 domain-containing protein [Acidobacteriota bacterium]
MRRLVSGIVAALALCGASVAKDRAPDWLVTASQLQTPSYEAEVPGVVLLKEESVSVSAEGVVTTRERYAVKILNRKGLKLARASAIYDTRSSKVQSLDAWIIYPSGQLKQFGKKETADAALTSNDIYNEIRMKLIVGDSSIDPGSVWGFESVVEDRSIFTQFLYSFQNALPTLSSRFSLTLPAGWRATTETFNAEPIEGSVEGSRTTWTLADLPWIRNEQARPSIAALAPRIAVSYFPPETAQGLGPSFESWEQVSTWLAALHEPRAQPDAAVQAKAAELTAGATTELDRVAAIARYAQNVKYVSIQTGVGRGGGYEPHAASEVLAKSYGDCK